MYNILKKAKEDDLTYLCRAYSRIIKKKPESFLYLPLASVYYRKGKIEKAINTMLKGVSLRPDYITGNCYLAFLYKKNGEIDKSVEIFKKVVSAAPDNYAARKALSEYYLDLKDEKRALVEMYELSRLFPSDKQLQDQIDLIEEQLNRNDDAHSSSEANNENESDEELLSISEDVRIDYIIFTLGKWLDNIDKILAKQHTT